MIAIITQSIRSTSIINLEDLSAQLINEFRRLKYKNKKQNKTDKSEIKTILFNKNSNKDFIYKSDFKN
jgi:hypothetical protein